MGGERCVRRRTGHVDLSMTRYVSRVLRDASAGSEDPEFVRARVGGYFPLQKRTPISRVPKEGISAAMGPLPRTRSWRGEPRESRSPTSAFNPPGPGLWRIISQAWSPALPAMRSSVGTMVCGTTTPPPWDAAQALMKQAPAIVLTPHKGRWKLGESRESGEGRRPAHRHRVRYPRLAVSTKADQLPRH